MWRLQAKQARSGAKRGRRARSYSSTTQELKPGFRSMSPHQSVQDASPTLPPPLSGVTPQVLLCSGERGLASLPLFLNTQRSVLIPAVICISSERIAGSWKAGRQPARSWGAPPVAGRGRGRGRWRGRWRGRGRGRVGGRAPPPPPPRPGLSAPADGAVASAAAAPRRRRSSRTSALSSLATGSGPPAGDFGAGVFISSLDRS